MNKFYKINTEYISRVENFFNNPRHTAEYIYAVYCYLNDKDVIFFSKKVKNFYDFERNFLNFLKNSIKNGSITKTKVFSQNTENQYDKVQTLKGVVGGTLEEEVETISNLSIKYINNNNNKEKEINKEKSISVFSKKNEDGFKELLIQRGADVENINEWFEFRRKSKKYMSNTVVNSIINASEVNNIPVRDLIRILAERQWLGVKYAVEEYKKSNKNIINFDF